MAGDGMGRELDDRSQRTPGPVVVAVFSHRYPDQVRRLIERVAEGHNTVVVSHHDPSGSPFELPRRSNVIPFPMPWKGAWGRSSLVHMQMGVISWVRENIGDFSWVLTISGQDYPVRRMSEIEDELGRTEHDAFLRAFPLGAPADDVTDWQRTARTRYRYKRRLPFSDKTVTLPWGRRTDFGPGISPVVGSFWVNLSARAADEVLDAVELRRRLDRFIDRAPVPDELYLPTLALNAAAPLDIANDHRRFVRWERGMRHPVSITAGHLPEIEASGAFFVRKLDMGLHPEVPDLLDDLADRRMDRPGV